MTTSPQPQPAPETTKLVLLRHGQSVWNRQHRLTGWSDVALTAKGASEARDAGRSLAAAGFQFDLAFTSMLRRAADSLDIVLEAMQADVEVRRCWQLNERHYGALEGLGPIRGVLRFGLSRVVACQRRFDVAPPPVSEDDPRYPANQPAYRDVPRALLPRAETMAQAMERMVPLWNERIAPAIRQGRRVLVVGHKNILRAMVKQIGDLDPAEVERLGIRTGQPWVFELDPALKPIRRYVIEDSD
ncbi:MAG: 2,3-bisphosphoglycerate-dependent phosphoglycerate mutase [Gammaproteobacteria bacterium]|jgi:2,3-bisphosphoglycerate-dependent phosphoglycerate mutase